MPMNWKRLLFLALSAFLAAQAVAFAQDDTEASMERAKRLYRSGNFRGALEELSNALDSDPSRADALYLVGYSHLMLREYPASVEAFRRAFEADPNLDPRTIYQRRRPEPTEP
jgi:tetratricopeptide (TPR) repeat protein